MPGDRLPDLLRRDEGRGKGCLRQQDHEFLPPPAGRDIDAPDLLRHPPHDGSQDLVADEVPVGIVHQFEVINIIHDQ